MFLTYTGPSGQPGPMTSFINKSVNSIRKTAGVKKKLSVTGLRKVAATKVRLHYYMYIKIILNTNNAFLSNSQGA